DNNAFCKLPKGIEIISKGNALLAECADGDTIWGVGLNHHDNTKQDVCNWRGKNYLGIILMDLREEFKAMIA
ncbi:MAG: NADAR domain-containing protein, partial [Oscillospiraceae bacterium]